MTLIRLCADTFVRRYGDVGYVTNQLFKKDLLFDDIGADFLCALSRQPRSRDEIVAELLSLYKDASLTELGSDFDEFIGNLSADGFVVRGESAAELDRLEPRFRYADVQHIIEEKNINRPALKADASTELSDTQTVLSRLSQDTPLLFNLQVELTSACNERCRHCYLPPSRHQRHADTAMVRRVINQFADAGGLSFTFGGGECLLHPDFTELLAHARNRDLSVSILSNLTRLDDQLLAAIKSARVSQLQVSVYSLKADEHDHITQVPGSLAKTLAAIERLVAADVPLQISCPVMRTNYRSYKDVLAWAQDRGMKAQTDFIMMARSDYTQDNLSERLNDAETVALLRDMMEVDRDYREDVESERDPLDTDDAPVCGVGRDTLTLGADGLYFPCAGWQGYPVGDANTQSLMEVWARSPELEHVRKIVKGDFPGCRTCADRDYCAMCLVRNFNESGGDMMSVATRFCEVAHLNRRIVEDWKQSRKAPSASPV